MSCIIMGMAQSISAVLAVFIKNTVFRNLRKKSIIVGKFLQIKLQNVVDKCLYKMQTVLRQYLKRQYEIFGL